MRELSIQYTIENTEAITKLVKLIIIQWRVIAKKVLHLTVRKTKLVFKYIL